jgi:hypothetical protein
MMVKNFPKLGRFTSFLQLHGFALTFLTGLFIAAIWEINADFHTIAVLLPRQVNGLVL